MKKKILSLAITGCLFFGVTNAFAGSLSASININESSSKSIEKFIDVNSEVTTVAYCDASSKKALDVKLKRGSFVIQDLDAPIGGYDTDMYTVTESEDYHLRLDAAFTLGSGAKGSASSSW